MCIVLRFEPLLLFLLLQYPSPFLARSSATRYSTLPPLWSGTVLSDTVPPLTLARNSATRYSTLSPLWSGTVLSGTVPSPLTLARNSATRYSTLPPLVRNSAIRYSTLPPSGQEQCYQVQYQSVCILRRRSGGVIEYGCAYNPLTSVVP